MRAGTLIRCARRDAVVALVWRPPARAPARRSAWTCSMMACPRCWDSACSVVTGVSVNTAGVEQHPLPTGLRTRVQAFHAAHDQPSSDLLGLGPAGERSVVDLGDLRIRDPSLLGFLPDGVRILDRCPRLLVDGGDRGLDRPVLPGGDRETGPGPPRGGHHSVGVERRLCRGAGYADVGAICCVGR